MQCKCKRVQLYVQCVADTIDQGGDSFNCTEQLYIAMVALKEVRRTLSRP